MGTFSAKMTLKDRYWFAGFSGTPPSEPNLSTPPPFTFLIMVQLMDLVARRGGYVEGVGT